MDVRSQLLRADRISLGLQNATQLAAKGRLAEARKICEQLLATYPGDAEVHNMAGVVAISEKRRSEALHHFDVAVKRDPNNVGYLNNLARLFIKVDRLELAAPVFLRILKLDPTHATAVMTIADFYQKLGRAEYALPFVEDYLKRKPDNLDILMIKGRTLEVVGRHDEAEEIYQRLTQYPALVPFALARLANVKRHASASPLLDQVHNALAQPGLQPAQLKLLHSAAGKVLEDTKDYDQAFHHYELSAKYDVSGFEIEKLRWRYDTLREIFTRSFLAARQGFGSPSQVPVLVVGMPRSGTTLTEQIISRHSLAGGASELGRLKAMARTLGFGRKDFQGFGQAINSMTAEQAGILASNYLELLRFYSKDGQRVVDKLPHNFEILGFAALLFPNAHIIHCNRDAIDTCLSIYVNRFNESHNYANDLTNLGSYYRMYAELMDHWREVLPRPMYESHYEELTDDPDTKVRELIAGLGLPWDDACLSHNEAKSTVMTLSLWQVRQPVYKTSVKRWKRFEKHLGPLIDALGDVAKTD
jgi:tetratricopeptide (TPR) repeat protein